jgi:hypothetical protein
MERPVRRFLLGSAFWMSTCGGTPVQAATDLARCPAPGEGAAAEQDAEGCQPRAARQMPLLRDPW